jgi:transposase
MLGIDVSKDTLHCTLLEPITRRPVWSRTYANTPQGISRLLKATTPECPWALEPTGSYSSTVVKHAREAQRDVRLAEPRRAKRFLQSIQNRAKCDRLDSAGLGLYALCHELPPYPLKSPLVEQLDQLLKARKGLALSLQQLQAQSRALPHASAALQPAIDALKTQQRHIEQEIEALSSATSSTPATPTPATPTPATPTPATPTPLSCVRELQKVPGIGPVTAATLASRLSGRSFARSDAFVAYCGLDIAIKQSGQKRGNSGLTKQGDAELRRLLYLCAQSSLRAKNSPFKAHYERERRKGLSSTAALCAVARKMARLCWSLVQHNQSYDPERVYQQSTKNDSTNS